MNASTPETVDPGEAEHFGGLAADWWNPRGSSAMLHRMNPARLRYIRAQVDRHWGGDARAFRPLAGRRALDVGCGAGLLAEPLARLGAAVTGIDAAAENIAVAQAHAAGQGLAIEYRVGGIERLFPPPLLSSEGEISSGPFDLVTSLEVIEHVAHPAAFIAGLARALLPGGLLILSTPNRTALSRLAMICVGEGLGFIPRGTHDWSKFLKPDELIALLEDAGLELVDRAGLGFSPAHGFATGGSEALDYFLTARWA